jgi:anti-sigma-K factor RskA
VLGTLAGEARAAFEAELARDDTLRRAVAAWSERLQPLADSVAPVAPPLALRDRVLTRIGQAGGDRPFSIVRWLAWTFGASALAAAVAVAAVLLFTPQPPELGGYAMLRVPSDNMSVVVFQIDKARSQVVMLAQTPRAGADKDYELWVLPRGKNPVSLGVLKAEERIERPIDAMRAALIQPGTTLAVSLEPAGGSPSGAPTGPVLYTGVFHLAGN